MQYEVIETGGEWVVQREGQELARFAEQAQALDHVAGRLRGADPEGKTVSLKVSYEPPGA